jgi:hypothetical protein
MKITRANYEIFAVDFLEGKLTPADAAEFLAFLKSNADIADEFEQIHRVSALNLTPGNLPDFSYLHKDLNSLEINTNNFEEMCIAYHEGDLNEKSQNKLKSFIGNNTQLLQKFELSKRAKISPDLSVTFRGKSGLKQKEERVLNVRRIILISSFAAAASLATLFMLRQQSNSNNTNQIVLTTIHKNNAIKDSPSSFITKTPLVKKSVLTNGQNNSSISIIGKEDQIMIAVVDTADSGSNSDILISMIESGPIQNTLNYAVSIDMKSSSGNTSQMPSGIELIKETGTTLYAKATQITVNEIIQTGIKGINNMVEGDLKFQSETDSKGRLTEFALSSESFNFKRKVGSN